MSDTELEEYKDRLAAGMADLKIKIVDARNRVIGAARDWVADDIQGSGEVAVIRAVFDLTAAETDLRNFQEEMVASAAEQEEEDHADEE